MSGLVLTEPSFDFMSLHVPIEDMTQGTYERTPEHRRQAAERHKGNTHAVGVVRSPEYREALSKRMTGKFVGEKSPCFVHGMSRTPTYSSWCAMKARCYDPNNVAYARYGARGITVCDRWLDFIGFLADMGERPEGMVLGRIDHDRGYGPDNVEWTTRSENTAEKNTREPKHELKRRAVREALIADPAQSNNRIKYQLKAANETISTMRRELEDAGLIPKLVATKGKRRRDGA